MLILPNLTLVTGGAGSEKSKSAERLAINSTHRKISFATEQNLDEEMLQKGEILKERRGSYGETKEPGLELADAVATAPVEMMTDEVGQGVALDTSLGRQFRNLESRFNQKASALADSVVSSMSGLRLDLIGPLPSPTA